MCLGLAAWLAVDNQAPVIVKAQHLGQQVRIAFEEIHLVARGRNALVREYPLVVLVGQIVKRREILDDDRLQFPAAFNGQAGGIFAHETTSQQLSKVEFYLADARFDTAEHARCSRVAKLAGGLEVHRIVPGPPQCIRQNLYNDRIQVALAGIIGKLRVMVLAEERGATPFSGCSTGFPVPPHGNFDGYLDFMRSCPKLASDREGRQLLIAIVSTSPTQLHPNPGKKRYSLYH